jgi:hypothetical protein
MTSAFAAGLGYEQGDLLPDLLAVALRAVGFDLVMFGNAVLQGKFTVAGLALVIVSGHGHPSFSSSDYPVNSNKPEKLSSIFVISWARLF